MAVRVKHPEGASVDHRGALQLWNGGALARRGCEDQATGALVYTGSIIQKVECDVRHTPRCTIILIKKKGRSLLSIAPYATNRYFCGCPGQLTARNELGL